MKRGQTLRRSVFFVGLIFVLTACAGGTSFEAGPPVEFRTEFRNDVGSWCAKSEPAYDAHRYSCAVTPVHVACTPANMTAAKEARGNTKKLCDSKPQETPANVSKIKALVETQQAIARKR